MSLVSCTVHDLMGPLTKRTKTAEGFLVAPGTIAKAGNVQEYRASELGFDVTHGMDANKIVRLYRPTSEVHSPETIRSFEGQTLTMGHPFGGVDAEKWKGVSVGDIRHVRADGDAIVAELVFRDATAIKKIESGSQLSCGYTFDCDMTAGTTADGKPYDGSMSNIRGNHVAADVIARGGPGCRVDDENRTNNDGQENPMITLVVDGITLTFADDTQRSVVAKVVTEAKDAAKVATDAASVATAKAADAETKLAAAEKAKADLVVAHDARVKELEAKILRPEQIEALASERSKVVADGTRLFPELKDAGKTVPQIRAEVVTHLVSTDGALKTVATAMLDGLATDKAPEASITAAFKACAAVPAVGNDGDSYDKDVGRRLAGSGNDSAMPSRGLISHDLVRYRETHGGKLPGESAA